MTSGKIHIKKYPSIYSEANIIKSLGSKLYYSLRIFLRKKRWLVRFAQVLRFSLVVGPGKGIFIRYHQKFRKNTPLRTNDYPIFPALEEDKVVNSLKTVGYFGGIRIPDQFISEILNYCEKHNRKSYWNPHKDCKAIEAIAHNAKVVAIAKKYLGNEPILWLSQLKWTLPPFGSETQNFLPPSFREARIYDQNSFHHDALDFKSLTIFIYLTDVTWDSAPHIVIEGTHNSKSFFDLRRIVISDDFAYKKYGDRVKVMLGKKGTVLFEDTSCYHKVDVCKKKRLMLSIDYVLQRMAPPQR